jgi:hypothetical protein
MLVLSSLANQTLLDACFVSGTALGLYVAPSQNKEIGNFLSKLLFTRSPIPPLYCVAQMSITYIAVNGHALPVADAERVPFYFVHSI